MVNGVGSYNNYMSNLQTQTARGRPDPAEMFNKVDTDGSGGVSQSELETLVQDLTDKTGNSIDSTNAVSTYDTDGNGELSQDELKSFMEATMPPPGGIMRMGGGQGHGDPFNALDTDSSGGISQTELDEWIEVMADETGNRIDTTDAVSSYDTDGDGELGKDELKSFMDASGMAPPPPHRGPDMMNGVNVSGESSNANADSIISAYDTNSDGELSSDELQAFLDNFDTSSSLASIVQQAITAYGSNLDSESFFNVEDAFMTFNRRSGYSPIDLSV